METIVRDIEVKSVMTKSNLPVADFSVNPYVGCAHACKYCYASFMKRFTNHPEPWGINTLDEDFRREMDRGVSIERRLEAMRQFLKRNIK